MRMTTLQEEMDIRNFAAEAACHFKDHPEHRTYGDEFPEPGSLLALRWGGLDDCVLVVKLDPDFLAVNFQQAIR